MIRMHRTLPYLLVLWLAAANTVTLAEHEHDEEDGDENREIHLSDKLAKAIDIKTDTAQSQVLHRTITSFGTLQLGADQLSHVRARFPGMLRSVSVDVGDRVSAGDVMAEVESDSSLKNYTLEAPISGTIIQRHANRGESAREQILFTIASYDQLWAELRIYPEQLDRVSAGLTAHIVAQGRELISSVSHVIPVIDKPYKIARVSVNNSAASLSPGLMVEGHIVLDEDAVALAVHNSALQKVDEQLGVFVKDHDHYRFTPVLTGRADDRYTEILQGLKANDVYVFHNSYVLKAELEKSTAGHSH
ncbi:MAG: acetyl-CoA carboxylase biotin carboxyl carrier protein subunit [Gammaproteobacteria bacterium]|nr:MAG: acetyl-CoA carboxylase biotin carboxyl carrier protein subunit [Gammaproteobacteria bacterium]